MIPYLVLIFVPLVFMYVTTGFSIKKGAEEKGLSVEDGQRVPIKSLLIPVFFLIFFVILVLRGETVGYDIATYHNMFKSISFLEFESVLSREGDVLYHVFNWVVSRFTDDFRVFLVIAAAITLIPIGISYSEDREWSYLKVMTFMVMPTFMMIFSGLRQAIAFSVGLIAYRFVREKRIIPFIIFAAIAVGFHHSAFMVFLFYPLYHFSFKKKHLWFIIPSIAAVFLFNRPIFVWLTRIASRLFGEDYSADLMQTEGYAMLLLFILLAIFAYVLPGEKKMDKETLGLRNFLLMAVLLQCFAPVHTLAMRMNYYFILFIPNLLPKIIKYRKDTFRELGYLAGWVLTVFFLGYYLLKLYQGCQSGEGSLGIYPYVPFWK